jgi:hypothetical protein
VASRTPAISAILSGFLLVLFFAYAVTWIAQCVGLNSKSPESAGLVRFHRAVPLAFVSNAMVPTAAHAGVAAGHRRLEPRLAVCAGVRDLWNNPNPSHVINAWPMQHPVEARIDLVGGHHRRRRPACVLLLQQALHGLSTDTWRSAAADLQRGQKSSSGIKCRSRA